MGTVERKQDRDLTTETGDAERGDQMGVIVSLAWVLLLLWATVLVHEAGHYAFGRMLGVPSDSVRLEMRRPPASSSRPASP